MLLTLIILFKHSSAIIRISDSGSSTSFKKVSIEKLRRLEKFGAILMVELDIASVIKLQC